MGIGGVIGKAGQFARKYLDEVEEEKMNLVGLSNQQLARYARCNSVDPRTIAARSVLKDRGFQVNHKE